MQGAEGSCAAEGSWGLAGRLFGTGGGGGGDAALEEQKRKGIPTQELQCTAWAGRRPCGRRRAIFCLPSCLPRSHWASQLSGCPARPPGLFPPPEVSRGALLGSPLTEKAGRACALRERGEGPRGSFQAGRQAGKGGHAGSLCLVGNPLPLSGAPRASPHHCLPSWASKSCLARGVAG